jgi:membrane protein involved in colicin uptake
VPEHLRAVAPHPQGAVAARALAHDRARAAIGARAGAGLDRADDVLGDVRLVSKTATNGGSAPVTIAASIRSGTVGAKVLTLSQLRALPPKP